MKMRLIISIMLIGLVLLTACGSPQEDVKQPTTVATTTTLEALPDNVDMGIEELDSLDSDLEGLDVDGLDDLDW